MSKRTSFLILLFLSFLILLSFFSGCLPVTPEPEPVTGTIYGYVAIPDDTTKDLTGYSPIPGATVTIVDADGVTHTVLTDENGYYFFNNISIKTNTIINITKDTEGEGKLIFKGIVPLAVSQEEDYDAGIANAVSTATALVVEELVNLGQPQEEIDLDEITSSDGFDELKEDIQQAQEDNQDINTDPIIPQAEEIADNIVNPPDPTPALSSAKEISSYKFEAAKNAALTADVIGIVNSGDHTIALTVPYGTDITALVATFELSTSASTKIESTTQVSGTTANDFTSPVTYTITAENGSTQDFTVTVTVAIGPLDHFTISGYPTSTTAGENFASNNIIITAYDGNNKIKTDYTGQVYFTSTDGSAIVPYTLGSKYTFTTGDNGVHTFPSTGFTLKTAGSQTITLTEGTVSVLSSSITVNPADANYFIVTGTASMTAGGSNTITITAYDQYDNVATGYDGEKTLTFSGASSSSDPETSPTCSNKSNKDIDFDSDTVITFTGGVGTSTMKLYKAETAHIKATQGSIATSDDNDLEVTVSAAAKNKLIWVDQPAASVAVGATWNAFTIEITDTYGNRTSDTDEVTITPSSLTLGGDTDKATSAGLSTFNDITCSTAGTITITGSAAGLTPTPASNEVMVCPTITFDKNDDAATGTMSAQTIPSGTSAALTACEFTKTGWTFDGWYETETLDGTVWYADGGSYTMGTADITLYAKWTPPATYSLRDIGPAGGWIFYVKGEVSNGWRYLEAAPAPDEGDVTAEWGCEGTISGADGEIVGTGEQNTIDIEVQCTTAGTAADICTNLSLGGYSDWFLPSKDELDKMWINLKRGTDENSDTYTPVGDFAGYFYWSSSEYNLTYAWCQYFSIYNQSYSPKSRSTYHVRAVRAF